MNWQNSPLKNPYPILRINNDGVILYVNDASYALLNLWGNKFGEVVPGEYNEKTYQRSILMLQSLKSLPVMSAYYHWYMPQ